jgi:hypothetical protein
VTTKRILCLANSRKLSGRCLAGREYYKPPGAWVRPISARPSEEVSEHERAYQDGTDPKVLDIVDIPLIDPRPNGYQQENWLLDPEYYWVRQGTIYWSDLPAYAERPAALWDNGSSTYNGLNDYVPLSQALLLKRSLYLIHVEDMEFHVFAPGAAFGNPKRRVQGKFSFGGSSYWLWVTDPVMERAYLARDNGSYQIGECYATISLGEALEGRAYKLIAAVILPQ